VIGWIARLGRTIFVTRNRSSVAREQDALVARLAAGDNVILFPEGTTSDGNRILPFASSFLALADAAAKPYVQPVTLVYDALDGLPVGRYDRPEISWYGDMALAPHFKRIGQRRRLHATIILDAAIPPGHYPHRKAITLALEHRLARNAAALRQGRFVK
jgi:1-acyl-sn-glycerol-3-phosphate acyltransferase